MEATVSQLQLRDLVPDARNANKGTARGRKVVAESLKAHGAGRSILLDSQNRIIAGNKTAEGAAIGLSSDDVIIVDSDGSKLIAIRRTDLDLERDPAAKALAIADNRASELGLDWDLDNLRLINAEVPLAPFFAADELNALGIGDPLANGEQTAAGADGHYKEQYGLIIVCEGEAQQKQMFEKLTAEGYAVRVVVT